MKTYAILLAALAQFLVNAAEPQPDAGRKSLQAILPERLVSENVFLYVTVPDFRRARAAFERTAFRALLGEEEIAGTVNEAIGKIRDAYVKGDGTRPDAEIRRRNEEADLVAKLLPYMDGSISFAVDGDLSSIMSLASGALPRFMIIFSLPVGQEGIERQFQIEDALERYRSVQTNNLSVRDFDVGVGRYLVRGVEDGNRVEAWAFVENQFIYGHGKGLVEAAVARYNDGGAGSLATSANYQSNFREVARDDRGETVFYAQADARSIINANGLQHVLTEGIFKSMKPAATDAPVFAIGLQVPNGDQVSIREKILMRPAKDYFPKGVDACRGFTSRFASNDTLFYSASQSSFAAIYQSRKPQFVQAGMSADSIDQKMAQLLGCEVGSINEKLSMFKGEMAAFVNFLPRANFVTGTTQTVLNKNFQLVYAFEFDKDNPNWEKSYTDLRKSVETATGIQYKKLPKHATVADVYYQAGAVTGEEKMPGPLGLFDNLARENSPAPPFFTAFSMVPLEVEPGAPPRHFLLLSDDLSALKKAVAQSKPGTRTALSEDKRYKEIMGSFREQRLETIYFDLERMLEVYNSAIPAINKSNIANKDTLTKLPSTSSLRGHLYPMGAVFTPIGDGNSILIESSSPTGIVPLAGVLGSLIYPAWNQQRQLAISEEIDNRFKRISVGLHLYAADFDRFPPNLSELVPSYVNLHDFDSPFNRGAIASAADVDNVELTNLIYVPQRSLNDLSREVILYEKEPTKVESTRDANLLYHILTIDGHALALPKNRLDRLLAGGFESLGRPKATIIPGKGGKGTPVVTSPRTPPRAPPKPPPPRKRP